MTTQGETRLCPHGHQVPAGQRFCGECGEEITRDGVPPSPASGLLGQHRLALLAGLVVLVLIGGVLAAVLISGASGKKTATATGVSLDQIIRAACGTGQVTNEGAQWAGSTGEYRCDSYTFVITFASSADLQVWASSHSCDGSGYAVAGPSWIVTGIGDPRHASALVKLGGVMAC